MFYESNIVFSTLLISVICVFQTCSSLPSNYILDEPIYPFQQYVQVRKSYSVQHLPRAKAPVTSSNYDGNSPYPTFVSSASTHYTGTAGTENEPVYHQSNDPNLREEISNYKKQEVYEEKGFSDGAYDHYNHNHDKGNSESNAEPYYHASTSASSQQPLHVDGSSSNVLKYAESVLYDRDAHQHGIYQARANIYCPEVIDFNLDPQNKNKKQGEDEVPRPGENPKLRGLGDKITCLKNKYFGREPLSRAIFQHPSESKQSLITMGTMDQFMNNVHKNVGSFSKSQVNFPYSQFHH